MSSKGIPLRGGKPGEETPELRLLGVKKLRLTQCVRNGKTHIFERAPIKPIHNSPCTKRIGKETPGAFLKLLHRIIYFRTS